MIPGPLRPARFVQRLNRFSVEVVIQPEELSVPAQLPDLDRMQAILQPNQSIWVRSAPWTVVAIQALTQSLVLLDFDLSTQLIHHGLNHEALEEFAGWHLSRTDVPAGRTRVDALLETVSGEQMLLAINHATLVSNRVAFFPNAPHERATAQLRALIRATEQPGMHAGILFIVQRNDADIVRPAPAIDPAFAQALLDAQAAGVRLMARRLQVTLEEAMLGIQLPVEPLQLPP